MGQQQLLLIILVTILVGIATVVAINVFQETQEESNKEAVILDMLTAVPDARAYYKKPTSMGGGGGSFTTIDFDDLILRDSTENGTYAISDRNSDSFILTGIPSSGLDPVELTIFEGKIEWKE